MSNEQKIVVIDSSGEKHEFTGPVRFYHEGYVARVWNVMTNQALASFTGPRSIRVYEIGGNNE